MNKFVKFAAACVAVVCAFGAMGQPLYQCEMTVGGYAGSTTLENFPALVRISPARIAGFSYVNCRSGGADISFTDMDGNRFTYAVREVNTLLPTAVDEMTDSGWSLTLFTCNIGGTARITVRCEKTE